MTATDVAVTSAGTGAAAPRLARDGGRRPPLTSRIAVLGALIVSAVYFLLPLWWLVVAATKPAGTQFSGSGMWFSGFGLFDNIADLFAFRDAIYPKMLLNSLIYAGAGALIGTILSAMTGYALAKYAFRGRNTVFNVVLAAVLIPKILFTVPLFLMFSSLNLTDTYWAVIIPSVVSPFGVYLARVFAADAVPDEVIEAGRLDGAGEFRIFATVATRLMSPALVTIFLFQFVEIWNNYLLPAMVINDVTKQPITVGLVAWNSETGRVPYHLIVTGSFVAVLPLMVAFILLQRFWRSGLGTGAVK